MWNSLVLSVREHGWSWAIAIATALVIATFSDQFREIGDGLWQSERASNAYVLLNGEPLRGGFVSNTYGDGADVDSLGRFHPAPGWKSGSVLMIYGPEDASGVRSYLGMSVLRKTDAGEWQVMELKQ